MVSGSARVPRAGLGVPPKLSNRSARHRAQHAGRVLRPGQDYKFNVFSGVSVTGPSKPEGRRGHAEASKGR
jgi:hypothetical protein